MLGNIPKAIFQGPVSQGYFRNVQFPKRQVGSSRSDRSSPNLAAAPQRSKLMCIQLYVHLGSLRFRNCTFGKLKLEKVSLGKLPLGKYLTPI